MGLFAPFAFPLRPLRSKAFNRKGRKGRKEEYFYFVGQGSSSWSGSSMGMPPKSSDNSSRRW